MYKRILLAFLILVVIIQLIPVTRTNPDTTLEVPADETTRVLLKRACYDCHSNETKWPWYSYVAPVSWLVTHDVNHAREHFNFSEWDKYTEKDKAHILEEVIEEVEAGEMPLWFYLPLHSEAKILENDLATLKSWVAGTDTANQEMQFRRGPK